MNPDVLNECYSTTHSQVTRQGDFDSLGPASANILGSRKTIDMAWLFTVPSLPVWTYLLLSSKPAPIPRIIAMNEKRSAGKQAKGQGDKGVGTADSMQKLTELLDLQSQSFSSSPTTVVGNYRKHIKEWRLKRNIQDLVWKLKTFIPLVTSSVHIKEW